MRGWIRWGDGRRIHLEQERLLGMPLLVLYLPSHMRERTLKKAVRLLTQQRVTRVLTPPGFPHWELLLRQGLRAVDTAALRCALTPAWVETVLKGKGMRPENAVLMLTGTGEDWEVERVARLLCPMVRNLILDTPRGDTLSAQLRREFGMPVLPAGAAGADWIIRFESGPVLDGVRIMLPGAALPPDCEMLPLLGALWECGRVKTEDIVLQS